MSKWLDASCCIIIESALVFGGYSVLWFSNFRTGRCADVQVRAGSTCCDSCKAEMRMLSCWVAENSYGFLRPHGWCPSRKKTHQAGLRIGGAQNRFHHFLELNGSFKPKSRVSCSRLHLECARPKQSGPTVVLGGAEHGPPLIEFMKARVNVDVAG